MVKFQVYTDFFDSPKKYEAYKERINDVADKIIRKTAVAMMKQMIWNTPVDTGHAVDNWKFYWGKSGITGEEGVRSLRPSLKSEVEKDMARDIRAMQLNGEVLNKKLKPFHSRGVKTFGLVNVATDDMSMGYQYVPDLEYGKSDQAPYGMVRVELRKIRSYLDKAVAEVVNG